MHFANVIVHTIAHQHEAENSKQLRCCTSFCVAHTVVYHPVFQQH